VAVANIRSAIKRMKQNEKRRLRNRAVRSRVRSALKTARQALDAGTGDAKATVLGALRTLDKAAQKGVLHRNTAARKKSALSRRAAALP
jgi:small subunit ribosomal protein S20